MMPKYRIRAYVSWGLNYFKVQEQVWWGWKTVAKNIKIADNAAQIVRDLLDIEKEFEDDRLYWYNQGRFDAFMEMNEEKKDE